MGRDDLRMKGADRNGLAECDPRRGDQVNRLAALAARALSGVERYQETGIEPASIAVAASAIPSNSWAARKLGIISG